MTLVNEKFFEKRHKERNYLHFDKKRSPAFTYKYVINPSNIIKHSFYPFISYDLVDRKIKKVIKYYGRNLRFKPLLNSPSLINHELYPFISYKLKNRKFTNKDKYVAYNFKIRGISYACHLDR